jgi:hypothetical protein
MGTLATDVKIIDVDTHYSEPAICGRRGCRRSSTISCHTR